MKSPISRRRRSEEPRKQDQHGIAFVNVLPLFVSKVMN